MYKYLLIFILPIFLISCSEKTEKKSTSKTEKNPVSSFETSINSLKKERGVFTEFLGVKLGNGYKQVKSIYPRARFEGDDIEKQCGAYSVKHSKGFFFSVYDHRLMDILTGFQKIKRGTDLFRLKDSFIKKHGEPNDKQVSKDQIELNYFTGDTELTLTLRAEPKGITSEVHWTYHLKLSYKSSILDPAFSKSLACERVRYPPNIGDCVKFVTTGTGLLNGGDKIVTTGRVTMKSPTEIFVYITNIKDSNSIIIGNSTYWRKDEVAVPHRNIESCN
jgi:hypothetical protein